MSKTKNETPARAIRDVRVIGYHHVSGSRIQISISGLNQVIDLDPAGALEVARMLVNVATEIQKTQGPAGRRTPRSTSSA